MARAGDLRAVMVILELLEPRVERIGAHYARRTGFEREELVQEGIIAVLEGLAAMELREDDPAAYLVRLAQLADAGLGAVESAESGFAAGSGEGGRR